MGGKADVVFAEGALFVFVEAEGFVCCWRGGCHWGAFAEDGEGAGAENALAVYVHPGGHLLEEFDLIAVDSAVAFDGDVEEEIAVFADDVA